MKLTQLIAQYVSFRKSLGQDFESDGRRLRTFSRFVGESVEIDSVKPPPGGSVSRRPRAHHPLLAFEVWDAARVLQLCGHSRLSLHIPSRHRPQTTGRFVPHIYSREELRRLLDGTASYQKH